MLAAERPDRIEFARNVGRLHRNLALFANAAADWATAETESAAATAVFERLAAPAPADAESVRLLGLSYNAAGRAALGAGRTDAATERFARACDALSPLAALEPPAQADRTAYADSCFARATALELLGRDADAARWLAEADKFTAADDIGLRLRLRFRRMIVAARLDPAWVRADAARWFAGDRKPALPATAYAALLALSGDANGHHAQVARLLDVPPPQTDKPSGEADAPPDEIIRAWLLAPDVPDSPTGRHVAALAEKLSGKTPAELQARALAHYRAGRFVESAAAAQRSTEVDEAWTGQPINQLVLAMALVRQERADDARPRLVKVTDSFDRACRERPTTGVALRMSMFEHVAFVLLRREAQTLVRPAK